ncbi:MAG TPA: hypothetical protein VE955_04860 [Candidatus Dormibacteraeota bacterium]|nr:hypothetical protein [Candidatus Dormibacteraeota bacterium]
MAGKPLSRKPAIFLSVLGLLLIVLGSADLLGYTGTFILIGCGQGAISCMRVYTLDFIVISFGVVGLSGGIISLIREFLCTR